MRVFNLKFRSGRLMLAALIVSGGALLADLQAAPAGYAVTNTVATTRRERALIDAWRRSADPKALPVENMTMPIAHHENGRIRALFKAERALIPSVDSGYVRAQDVVIEMFDANGRLEGIFITDNCFYDRATGSGYCEGKVRIEQRGVHIRGVDMVWNLNDRNAKILAQAEVRFDRFIEGIGGLFK